MIKSKRISDLKAPVYHCLAAGHINVAATATVSEIVLASCCPVFLFTHSVDAADEFVDVDHGLELRCSSLLLFYARRVT